MENGNALITSFLVQSNVYDGRFTVLVGIKTAITL